MSEVALTFGHLLINLVRDPAVFAAMRPEWNDLLENSDAGVFNSWEWLYPWFIYLGLSRPLRILTARDEQGTLLGVMPLALHTVHIAGFKLRRLAFLGETHVGTDYLDVVARRGFEEEVALAFAETLRRSGNTWDLLDLTDIPSGSPTLKIFQSAFGGSEYQASKRPGSVCPYEVFRPGETFESFLMRTSRRANYRRRKKWLEKQPGYSITCATDPGSVDRALDDLIRLHALRWDGDGGSDAINSSTLAFHRDAAHYLAEHGRARIYTMTVSGHAVASVHGIVHNDTMYYYQSGRDPGWERHSVGLVLVGETFRDSIESGLRAYDFLQGEEPFKFEWASGERRTVGIRICRARGIGPWYGHREKAVRLARSGAKRVLPQAVKGRLARRAKR